MKESVSEESRKNVFKRWSSAILAMMFAVALTYHLWDAYLRNPLSVSILLNLYYGLVTFSLLGSFVTLSSLSIHYRDLNK